MEFDLTDYCDKLAYYVYFKNEVQNLPLKVFDKKNKYEVVVGVRMCLGDASLCSPARNDCVSWSESTHCVLRTVHEYQRNH